MTGPARQDLHGALGRLLGSRGPELTCEECFEHLDRYVELEVGGFDASREVPGMRAHLGGCPACEEEHRSLRAFLELERDQTPERRA